MKTLTVLIFLVILVGCATFMGYELPIEPRNPKYEPIVGEPMPTLANSPYPLRQSYGEALDGRTVTMTMYVSAETQEVSYFTVQVEKTDRYYQIVDVQQDRMYIDNDIDGLVDEIINDWQSTDDSINPLYGIPKPGRRI